MRQQVNYLAHKLGLQHAAEVHDTLLEQLEEDFLAGATTADMIKSVRDYEQAAKSAR